MTQMEGLVSIAFTDIVGYFSFSFNLSYKSTFIVQVSLTNGATITQKVTVKPDHVTTLNVVATI